MPVSSHYLLTMPRGQISCYNSNGVGIMKPGLSPRTGITLQRKSLKVNKVIFPYQLDISLPHSLSLSLSLLPPPPPPPQHPQPTPIASIVALSIGQADYVEHSNLKHFLRYNNFGVAYLSFAREESRGSIHPTSTCPSIAG